MGYRHYIGIICKSNFDKCKQESLGMDNDNLDIQHTFRENCRSVIEIGKYMDKEIREIIYKDSTNLFDDDDIELFVCNQNSLIDLANYFRIVCKKDYAKRADSVKKIYGKLKKNKKINEEDLTSISYEYYLSISYLYEHEMFNLMFHYITMDKENEMLICFAY